MYCPLELIVPGPEFASPPESVQFTPAEPPLSVAVNCSIGPPDALVALHPVQLVSIVPEPGETERPPLEEPPPDVPPHPATTTSAGNIKLANMRWGDCRNQ